MSLYHLFHGQAIPVHWVPAKVCENCHCEYNDLISLLTIAAALRNVIMCYTFQSAFPCFFFFFGRSLLHTGFL